MADVSQAMSKRVVDLSIDELEDLAGDAWNVAAQDALARGISVTGSLGGRRFRYHPDGLIEDLGPIAPLPEAPSPEADKTNRSVKLSRG
jgi:hypothetical protein